MPAINPAALGRHLRHLTEAIGVRLAGQPGEAAAADYVAGEWEKTGARVHQEKFPVQTHDVREQQLQVYHDGAWHDAGGSLFANTPGTAGAWVEAPLVFFEGPTGYQQADLAPGLRGRIVLHLGSHLESREHYRRLVAAGPAGLLMVDVRYPGATPLADAIFPAYAAACGAVPALNVAFLDAWRWRERGATRARFRVVGGPRPAESANVVAELPGTDPAAGVLYLGCHHDTQADSVGADDNGTGTAGLIELARVLAARPRRRTVRLISFGAEEQLSVGSAAYVRRHRAALARDGRCLFNLDSIGSLLGWNTLWGSGPRELDALLRLSPDGFVAFAMDGSVKFVNPAFLSMIGIDSEAVVGKSQAVLDVVLKSRCERPDDFAGVNQYDGDGDDGDGDFTAAVIPTGQVRELHAEDRRLKFVEP